MAQRRTVNGKAVARMSYTERGYVIANLLRQVRMLEDERLLDPRYRASMHELSAAKQELFATKQAAAREARHHMAAVASLERAVAVHRHDADCARAELAAVRAAMESMSLSIFQASEETLRALREAAREEVTALIDELDKAGQELAGEATQLRAELAEERDWAARVWSVHQERVEAIEVCFFAPARSARMKCALQSETDLPQVIFFTQDADEQDGYRPFLAASQYTDV